MSEVTIHALASKFVTFTEIEEAAAKRLREIDSSTPPTSFDKVDSYEHEKTISGVEETNEDIKQQLNELTMLIDEFSELYSQLLAANIDLSIRLADMEKPLAEETEELARASEGFDPGAEVVLVITKGALKFAEEKSFIQHQFDDQKVVLIPKMAQVLGTSIRLWHSYGPLSRFVYDKISATLESAVRESDTDEQKIHFIGSLWWIIKIIEPDYPSYHKKYDYISLPSHSHGSKDHCYRFMKSLQQLIHKTFTELAVSFCNNIFEPLINTLTVEKPIPIITSKQNSTEIEIVEKLDKLFLLLEKCNIPQIILEQFIAQCLVFISSSTFNYLVIQAQKCSPELGIIVKLNLSHIDNWLQRRKLGKLRSQLSPLFDAMNALSLMNPSMLTDESIAAEAFPSLNRAQILTLALNISLKSESHEETNMINELLEAPKVSRMPIMCDPFAEAKFERR